MEDAGGVGWAVLGGWWLKAVGSGGAECGCRWGGYHVMCGLGGVGVWGGRDGEVGAERR